MDVTEGIDRFINAESVRLGIPGLGVGIFRNGSAELLKGYGYANLELEVPVGPQTLFQSASIGKLFTAVAIMLLVEDGLLALDQSVRAYLADAPPQWQPITLRRLLNHTSGLGNAGIDLRRDFSDAELLQHCYASPLHFAPGGRWAYSNLGYSLLGVIASQAAGVHYGELLQERVFARCGMPSACLIDEARVIRHRAAGYQRVDGQVCNQDWVAPSHNRLGEGSLYLSLHDYAAWDRVVAERLLLSAASWQQVFSPALLNQGEPYPYGLGWFLDWQPGNGFVASHDGSWQGFVSHFKRYDEQGVTFVVLANIDDVDVYALIDGLAACYDSRYSQDATPGLVDDAPALTAELQRSLARLQADGGLDAMALVDVEPGEEAGVFDANCQAMATLGDTVELTLLLQRPNGDRLYREYRALGPTGEALVCASFARDGAALTDLNCQAL